MEIGETFNTCRLCLSGNDGLIHVFETRSFGYAPADVIAMLLRLEVSAEDRYPQYVCGGCLGKLREFKKFKEQCEGCKELLDRAYAARRKSLPDIKPNEVERCAEEVSRDCPVSIHSSMNTSLPLAESQTVEIFMVKQEEEDCPQVESQVSPLSKMTGDDSQIPNEEQMELCQEEESDPFGDVTDMKPSVLELNDGFCGVKEEPDEEGYNHEVERCAEEVSTVCPVTIHSSMNTSLPLAESQTVEIFTVKQEEEDCPQMESHVSSPMCMVTADYSQVPNDEHSVLFEEEESDPLADLSDIKPKVLEINDTLRGVKVEPHEEGSLSEDSDDVSDSIEKEGEEEEERKVFRCSECGKEYLCARSYGCHIDTHKFGKTLKCSHCDKLFTQKKSLSDHIKRHFEEELNCKICGKTFKNKTLMKSHLLHAHGDKNFKCDTCGRGFVSNGKLNQHKKLHVKGDNHVCGICDKTFENIVSFRRHMYNHRNHGNRQKKYACGVCDHKCYTPSLLVIHTRTHTKEKPFACPFACGARFSVKRSLDQHIKSQHRQEKR